MATQDHRRNVRMLRHMALMGICLYATPSFAQQPQENLLASAHVRFHVPDSVGLNPSDDQLLRDGDVATLATLRSTTKKPTEIVYSFDGKTVSLRKIKLKLAGKLEAPATIEILASTLSPTAGFKSLRTEPIKSSEDWQTYDFEESAATWVLLKFSPAAKDATIPLAELEIVGHFGPPVEVYEFNESPAKAIAVLSKLSSSTAAAVSDDEKSLFQDAADGQLQSWSFAEASLLSSGVDDKKKRTDYLKHIDRLEGLAREAVPATGDAFTRGKALLTWLHTNAFTGGYQEKQTKLSNVLGDKTFNCVSSATLYNILARRMDLEVRGIEVPTHAFSILYDGKQHADIETTTQHGFNPARNRSGASAFEKQTGFNYIPDIYRNKRREIDAAGLVALTYYNRGVLASDAKQYADALVNYFKALSLDPDNKSAVKNILSLLGNWSLELSEKGQLDKALEILTSGLELAPKHRTLRHNHKALLQHKITASITAGREDDVLALLKRAHQDSGDTDYVKMQAWVFTQKGEDLILKGDWEGALKIIDEAVASIDNTALTELEKWRPNVLLRWSRVEIDRNNFAIAADILERGLGGKSRNYKVENNLGYVAQQWSAHVKKTEGEAAGRELIAMLAKRFPNLTTVGNAAGNFADKAAKEAVDKGDYQSAIDIYQEAIRNRPTDFRLKENHRAIWVQWAAKPMKAGEWETALSIYERAMAVDPAANIFKQNVAYIVQEWTGATATQNGVIAGEELTTKLALRLPKMTSINNRRGELISKEVTTLISADRFDDAVQLLRGANTFYVSESRYNDTILHVYYSWAEPMLKKKQWPEVIEIFSRGHSDHPKNYKLKQNLIAAWHQSAEVHLKKEEWQSALDIYENALKALPNTGLFQQNIRYCKSKLGK